jgi:hypothetical protein
VDDHPSSHFKTKNIHWNEGRKEGRNLEQVTCPEFITEILHMLWRLMIKYQTPGRGRYKRGPMGLKLLARWKQLGDFKRGWLWEE